MISALGNLSHQWLELMTRWRRIKRQFDSRVVSERRILIIAAVCVSWFLLDAVWVTPSFNKLTQSRQDYAQASERHASEQARNATLMQTLALQKAQAAAELQQIRARMDEAQSMQDQMQSKLAPAREMRFFLEALLAKQGQLRVMSIQTMTPKAVAAPGSARALLYRHGLQIEVSGQFHDLLTWLRSAESMPKQLLWDELHLKTDEKNGLVLSVQVHTLSPDKEALEIAP